MGDLMGVGRYGCNWSATVSGIHGRFLWFSSQDLNIGSADNRAHGIQLRCLSE
ncbi:hypothetical protein [uncultured Rikenella sp.]|uniref:hypothetical protein n=1 Tax=uncultured Rikenella sp. TaxID=368003 RepID=UPI0025EB9B8F|nr:hypothetical protein [uncultured Rikenella sp.]